MTRGSSTGAIGPGPLAGLLAFALLVGTLSVVTFATDPGSPALTRAQGLALDGESRESTSVADLKLNGQDHVSGLLAQGNLAPGDDTGAVIDVTADPSHSSYDLDIDLTYRGDGPPLTTNLTFSVLTYGDDDLLRDPGRNLTREIDGDPGAGNGDGVITVEEFQAGVNDLPVPGPPADPTPMEIRIDLGEDAGNALQDRSTDATLIYYLAEQHQDDLN